MQDETLQLPRRTFLGKVTITVGGMTLAGMVPASLLHAAVPRTCLVDAAAWPDPCGDWQLDDVFTAYPPYSLHLAAAVPVAAVISAQVDAIDQHWVG
jgi:hypothetical protein